MNVAITGSSGFVGSNLLERLVAKKINVKALVRDNKKKFNQITYVKGDLLNEESLLKLTRNIDILFNCAAALPHHKLDEKGYWDTNVEGLKNIIEACQKNKVKRLIHISTIGIYGETTSRALNEKAPVVTVDAYSRTKAEGEKLLKKLMGTGKLKITIIRPTICYGPGDTRPGFLNLFKLVEKGLFIQVGSGENYFHTVYISNLIDALLLVSKSKKALNQDFIIGDDPCPKMSNITECIYRSFGKKKPPFYLPITLAYIASFIIPQFLPRKRVNFITKNRRFSVQKAKNILDYNPKISLDQGMNETYIWYKNNGFL